MTDQEFLERYLTDRRGTDCLKWDALEELYGEKDLLPMWIADTEFRTCDAVLEALRRHIDHGVFGYGKVPEGYFEAFSGWMERHYGLKIPREWVHFCTGCVTGITWLVRAFTQPGDACLVLTPVYYPFHSVVRECGRTLVTCDLSYENGRFSLDLEAVERAIVQNNVKLLIQCSPHNPVGRVWSEEELDAVLSLCRRHGVFVISDEIHQDIILWDKKFTPALAVRDGAYRDMLAVVTAPSKTFNLPGLLHSHILIADEALRERYAQTVKGLNHTSSNVLGMAAAQAAYTDGDAWHEGLLSVIEGNYTRLAERLKVAAPELTLCALEGTFLPLLDLRALVAPEDTKEFMVEKCRVAVDYGEQFGEHFKGFIRLNIATDPRLVDETAERILRALGRAEG